MDAAFAEHYDRLTALLARHAGGSDAARELLHDVWLRLEQTRTPPVAANAPAYIYATARNLLVDKHRHRRVMQAHESAPAGELQPAADNTLEAAAHRQALAGIERALAALPERTREIFLQHRLLEVPQGELAMRHGVSRATVEREVARGALAAQAALEHWQGERPRSTRRRSLGALLGVTAVLGGGDLAWRLWSTQVPQWQTAWRTPRGRQLTHTLPDGSRVTLDAQTSLAASYYGTRRELVLHAGAAFFDVARDETRPFSVASGALRITALGTRFAVERRGERVRVDVEHGRVRIDTPGGAIELGAGDGLVVDPADTRGAPQRVPAITAPWREGRLSFDRAPLADILERLSRYHPRPLVADPRVAAWPITAEIRIALADEWLRHVLPRALPVKAVEADGGLRIEPLR